MYKKSAIFVFSATSMQPNTVWQTVHACYVCIQCRNKCIFMKIILSPRGHWYQVFRLHKNELCDAHKRHWLIHIRKDWFEGIHSEIQTPNWTFSTAHWLVQPHCISGHQHSALFLAAHLRVYSASPQGTAHTFRFLPHTERPAQFITPEFILALPWWQASGGWNSGEVVFFFSIFVFQIH